MPIQADLFADTGQAPDSLPQGFRYRADLIDLQAEEQLAAQLAELPFQPFEFHGYLGARRVLYFGFRYDYSRRAVVASTPIPDFLLALREQVADFADRPTDAFVQVLATEYAPGAGIGWHRDKSEFGDVVGVSLLSPCRIRFRRRRKEGWDRASPRLERRSAYLLSGPTRHEWEHSIAPMDVLRYSITFRTMASGAPRSEH